MEFIKVSAMQCDNYGDIIESNSVTLYLNPDIIKAITSQKSIILKDDSNLDSAVMSIGEYYYTKISVVGLVSLNDLI